MNNFKSEKGSITLFVLVSMLFFVLFLTGIYMISSSKEEAGIGQTARIKEIYEKDINNINDVYATVIDKKTITLAEATNANIGDYIDLGNDPLGKGDRTKNWRILYVEKGTVYVILADYLPNSSGYATNAGLNTKNAHSVYSATDRKTLIDGLTHKTAWNDLANGIEKAQVTATPTAELLMKSYNTKHYELTEDLVYTNYPTLDTTDDLYVPHTSRIDGEACNGYWLMTEFTDNDTSSWRVNFDGTIGNNDFNSQSYGIRPVVALPSSTEVINRDNLWIIQK